MHMPREAEPADWFLGWVAREFHEHTEDIVSKNVTLEICTQWCHQNDLRLP